MSRFGETKKRIIELLNQKSMTLSQISERLNLAPSTVAQHLQELEQSGAIKRSGEQHSKKWVYYELNRDQGVRFYSSNIGKASLVAAILVLALVSISYALSIMPQNVPTLSIGPNGTIGAGATAFAISDDPSYYNITSLDIFVSKIEVHNELGKWYSINVNKGLDLVELKNISQIIAAANLPYGTYNQIVLYVDKANATLNGNLVNVFIPSKKLRIEAFFNITNSSANFVNIDFKLEDSIHITGNGEVILTPVIGFGYSHENSIRLSKFIARGVKLRNEIVLGMNENGAMVPNSMLGYWITVRGNRIMRTNGSMGAIIVRTPHSILIQNTNISAENASNVSVSIGNINARCKIRGNIIFCYLNHDIMPSNISSIINELNLTNRSIIENSSYELNRLVEFYKGANDSMLYCNTSSDCSLVPLSLCQNNLPYQQACINNSYYSSYMEYYNYFKEHIKVMCPMFIVLGHTSCSCIEHTCVAVYKGPIVMPK